MLRYTVRPISDRSPFTGKHEWSSFDATWTATLDLLEREYKMLGGRNLVFEVDVPERGIRNDGQLRADVQASSPAVRIAFDSKHGPLVYATDRFRARGYRGMTAHWQHNVRAIALGLEALRRVDRYGISRRGEQYTGWKAIGSAATAIGAGMSKSEAAELLLRHAGWWGDEGVDADDVIDDVGYRGSVYKQAAKNAHPDHGGTTEAFQTVNAAKRTLDQE